MAPLELPTLAGDHCLLRPWTLDDAPALREACGDEDICRFTTVPQRYSLNAAVQWIERQHAHAIEGTAIVLAVLPAGDHVPVGMVGLFGLDQPERSARFGYWLIARARRQGLAACAAEALRDWAFERLDVDALVIDCEPTNVASARIAAHLGAAFTGSRSLRAGAAEVELDRYTLTRT